MRVVRVIYIGCEIKGDYVGLTIAVWLTIVAGVERRASSVEVAERWASERVIRALSVERRALSGAVIRAKGRIKGVSILAPKTPKTIKNA